MANEVKEVEKPKASSPESVILAEHANWLLDTMHSWVHEGWANEVKGRLLIMRDVAAKLP